MISIGKRPMILQFEVMRPLFYDFWEDETAATVDDQLMFGPDYLVAPVLVENATERFVYLPKLAAPFVWQDYFSGSIHNTTMSSLNITVVTPLDTFPLFRRHRAVCYVSTQQIHHHNLIDETFI